MRQHPRLGIRWVGGLWGRERWPDVKHRTPRARSGSVNKTVYLGPARDETPRRDPDEDCGFGFDCDCDDDDLGRSRRRARESANDHGAHGTWPEF